MSLVSFRPRIGGALLALLLLLPHAGATPVVRLAALPGPVASTTLVPRPTPAAAATRLEAPARAAEPAPAVGEAEDRKAARKQLVLRILIGVGAFLAVGTALALGRQLARYLFGVGLRRDLARWRAYRAGMSRDELRAYALQQFFLVSMVTLQVPSLAVSLRAPVPARLGLCLLGLAVSLGVFAWLARVRRGRVVAGLLAAGGLLLILGGVSGGGASGQPAARAVGELLGWAGLVLVPLALSSGLHLLEPEPDRRRWARRLAVAYWGVELPVLVGLRVVAAARFPDLQEWVPWGLLALATLALIYVYGGLVVALRVRITGLNGDRWRRWEAAESPT